MVLIKIYLSKFVDYLLYGPDELEILQKSLVDTGNITTKASAMIQEYNQLQQLFESSVDKLTLALNNIRDKYTWKVWDNIKYYPEGKDALIRGNGVRAQVGYFKESNWHDQNGNVVKPSEFVAYPEEGI